jgi:hypothetical protein
VHYKVTESGATIWKTNAYVPGVPGWTSAADSGDFVTFRAGSGSYVFTLNGNIF